MIRIGFPLFGHGASIGAHIYLRTTLRLIRDLLDTELRTVLLLAPHEALRFGTDISSLAHETVTDPAFAAWGRGRDLVSCVACGRSIGAATALRHARLDVAVETASFIGWAPGMRVLTWMTDFQHRLLPEMFPRKEWLRREIGFQVQASSRKAIMLSSNTARRDCEQYYPRTRGRIHVVRFASGIDLSQSIPSPVELRQKYELPDRFIYLPNQFWRHKNHTLVLDALTLLRCNGAWNDTLPIIASGPTTDPRNPDHFSSLMNRVEKSSLAEKFRHLGSIPYEDVLGMMTACAYLINPSKVEGWSTTIEEAKTLGTKALLSDIDVHREQAPSAWFFSATDAEACAERLLEAAKASPVTRPCMSTLRSAHEARRKAHAEALLLAVRAAVR